MRLKVVTMLSKTAIHAVTALTALAWPSMPGAADIARDIGAPPNYLGKLLKTLADVGRGRIAEG